MEENRNRELLYQMKEGKTHCQECLMLDGCFFQQGKAPLCPHHPYCRCTLEDAEYETVLASASAYSDYSKFDPYLFDPNNSYRHGKNRAFKSWGYSISDSLWLTNEMEGIPKISFLKSCGTGAPFPKNAINAGGKRNAGNMQKHSVYAYSRRSLISELAENHFV